MGKLGGMGVQGQGGDLTFLRAFQRVHEDARCVVGDEAALTMTQFLSLTVGEKLPAAARPLAPICNKTFEQRFSHDLEKGLIDKAQPGLLTTMDGKKRGVQAAYTLPQCATLLWNALRQQVDDACLDYMSSVGRRRRCISNRKSIQPLDPDRWKTLASVVAGAKEDGEDDLMPTSVDDCVEHIQELCACAIGVSVDSELLRAHLTPLCLHIAEPSRLLARTFARCDAMRHLVGQELMTPLRMYVYRQHWDIYSADSIELPSRELLVDELVRVQCELSRQKIARLNHGVGLSGDQEEVGHALQLMNKSLAHAVESNLDQPSARQLRYREQDRRATRLSSVDASQCQAGRVYVPTTQVPLQRMTI